MRTAALFLRIFLLTVALLTPTAVSFAGLRGFQHSATPNMPISVRFVGEFVLTPNKDIARHKHLLPLRLSANHIVYLQVDEFHTASKNRGELSLLQDMRRREPQVRVVNGDTLTTFLREHEGALQGEKIALNGFFYQVSGLLMVAETHLVTASH
jgi:hypothetical protein